MKTLAFLFLTAALACAADKPTVEVYLIRKYGDEANARGFPEVIFELSNPTESTFHIAGSSIESPTFQTEAQREGRWLRIPNFVCGNGMSSYPFRPGTKMLVTVLVPLEEPVTRYRFFFTTSSEPAGSKLVSVWSRAIDRKELGDLTGTLGELTSKRPLRDPFTDAEYNKGSGDAQAPADSDPFVKKAPADDGAKQPSK